MSRYSDEFKEQVVRKMMPPNAQSVAQVHRETGISEPTLYAWRNRYRGEGQVVPADPSNPESWSGENKLAVVIETAALNEQELAEYCRRKGLYPEQIQRWREAAAGGNDDTQRLSGANCRPSARRRVGSRRSSGARTRRWPRRRRCWCCKKKPGPSGGTTGTIDHVGRPSDGH